MHGVCPWQIVLQVISMNFLWKQHGFLFSHPVYLAVDQTSNVSSESNVERNKAFNQL